MLLDSSGGNVFPDNLENIVSPGQKDRFRQQIEFILEVDKLKNVLRKTILMDRSRRENSAEHSWHIALTVLILSEYTKDSDVDLLIIGPFRGRSVDRSVEIRMKSFTPVSRAARAVFRVPKVLFLSPSMRFCSTMDTCL